MSAFDPSPVCSRMWETGCTAHRHDILRCDYAVAAIRLLLRLQRCPAQYHTSDTSRAVTSFAASAAHVLESATTKSNTGDVR